eukprot:gnl/MRDRNA2_/MRDRNA2_93445_c0_seq1.p1 gnl/MRDRNA2_/MRDRNA2_93445_c0~~gnl/MRDRNA2_/MRDRNA2_93445_c0_seq1.p1  ORF type:complete len:181 (-),score=48.30 gnl/MRDRNA2_/MRDRNA2_93445_c0_seq1:144-686(-)
MPCRPRPSAAGIAAMVVAAFVFALVDGYIPIEEGMAELAIIALIVPLGLGITFHRRMSEKGAGVCKKHVAEVTELSPPSSPRQEPQSDAAGAPLVKSYEADWAKLPAQTLPAEFNLAGRGSGRRDSALAVLKHRQELALRSGDNAQARSLEREKRRLESTEDDVWSADWTKIGAAVAVAA